MNFAKTAWRLIRTTEGSGAWNMALDEAILEASGCGDVPPTLRLYLWQPPCLSLGIAQSINDVDLEMLSSLKWELVRRPTGGRAILHTDEITYSVSGPQSDPRLAGGVLESYRILAQAILYGLHRLGMTAEAVDKVDHFPRDSSLSQVDLSNSTASVSENPVCFEVPSRYEITVRGKKLVGSAQARRKEGVLQHGTLPLCGDLTRIINVLHFTTQEEMTEAKQRLLDRATTVEKILGYPISWEKAAAEIEEGFKEALNLELHAVELTQAEIDKAHHLMEVKYANPGWTSRI
jgi:lipoate-protein ligase A